MEDLYSILGVSRSATQDEIKKAYRNLSMQFHPDRNNGDKACEEKFKEINAAYDVLGDATKRRQYDLSYSQGFSSSSTNSTGNTNSDYGHSQGSQYDPFGGEFYSDNFGQGANSGRTYYYKTDYSYDENIWEKYKNKSDYRYSEKVPDSFLGGVVKVIGSGILGFIGFSSLAVTIALFPIGPALSLFAIVKGITGVFYGLTGMKNALFHKK